MLSYLKLDGIPGDSEAQGRAGWITLEAFELGGPHGRSRNHEISFYCFPGPHTSPLFHACAAGSLIHSGVLEWVPETGGNQKPGRSGQAEQQWAARRRRPGETIRNETPVQRWQLRGVIVAGFQRFNLWGDGTRALEYWNLYFDNVQKAIIMANPSIPEQAQLPLHGAIQHQAINTANQSIPEQAQLAPHAAMQTRQGAMPGQSTRHRALVPIFSRRLPRR
jgi:hypothetical protein